MILAVKGHNKCYEEQGYCFAKRNTVRHIVRSVFVETNIRECSFVFFFVLLKFCVMRRCSGYLPNLDLLPLEMRRGKKQVK